MFSIQTHCTNTLKDVHLRALILIQDSLLHTQYDYMISNMTYDMLKMNKCYHSPPQPLYCVAGVVQGGSVSYICTQIMTIVEQEQNKVLWIPDGAP